MTSRNQSLDVLRGVAIPYYVRAFCLAIPAMLVGLQIPGWAVFIPSTVIERQADFRAFYGAGYTLRTGHGRELYQYDKVRKVQDRIVAADDAAMPFIHPAYEAMIFVPLSLLPFKAAYLLWVTCNLGLLALIYRLLKPQLDPLREIAWWLPPVMLFAFTPIPFTIVNGQDSLMMLVLILFAMEQMREGRNVLSGLILGGAVFRFQFLLPLVILFAAWKMWRFLVGFALSALGMLAASVAVAGVDAQRDYVALLKMLGTLSFLQPLKHMPNLRGFLYSVHPSLTALAVCSFIVVGMAIYYGRWADSETRWCLALSASALVTYHFLLHDMSALFVVIAVMCARIITTQQWKQLPVMAVVLISPAVVVFSQDATYLAIAGSAAAFVWSRQECFRSNEWQKLPQHHSSPSPTESGTAQPVPIQLR